MRLSHCPLFRSPEFAELLLAHHLTSEGVQVCVGKHIEIQIFKEGNDRGHNKNSRPNSSWSYIRAEHLPPSHTTSSWQSKKLNFHFPWLSHYSHRCDVFTPCLYSLDSLSFFSFCKWAERGGNILLGNYLASPLTHSHSPYLTLLRTCPTLSLRYVSFASLSEFS